MKMRFVHETLSQRVHFAAGAAADAVAEEVDRLGSRRVMLIAAPSAAELARAVTARVPVTLVHDEVAMHVPVPVAERARAAASEHSVDVVISVGGGSATGLAKAIALTSGLPVIAVPTTYAGSEATDVWGLTDDAHKITGSDPRVLPRAVVYDASLTLTLPVDLSVASGLNGLAHCVDALWAPRADPINAALATEGIRTLAQGLRLVVDEPRPPELEKMSDIARALGAGWDFIRIDLYAVDGEVWFGEFTPYPGSGLLPYRPMSFDVAQGMHSAEPLVQARDLEDRPLRCQHHHARSADLMSRSSRWLYRDIPKQSVQKTSPTKM